MKGRGAASSGTVRCGTPLFSILPFTAAWLGWLAGWLAGWRMVDVGLWAFSSGTSINMTKQWICEKNNR